MRTRRRTKRLTRPTDRSIDRSFDHPPRQKAALILIACADGGGIPIDSAARDLGAEDEERELARVALHRVRNDVPLQLNLVDSYREAAALLLDHWDGRRVWWNIDASMREDVRTLLARATEYDERPEKMYAHVSMMASRYVADRASSNRAQANMSRERVATLRLVAIRAPVGYDGDDGEEEQDRSRDRGGHRARQRDRDPTVRDLAATASLQRTQDTQDTQDT